MKKPSLHKSRKGRIIGTHENLKKLPTDAETIVILVERIKHPHLSIEQLSMRLSKMGYQIKPEAILNFFENHGL